MPREYETSTALLSEAETNESVPISGALSDVEEGSEEDDDDDDEVSLIKTLPKDKNVTLEQSILTVDFLLGTLWFLILCVRMSSWLSWMHVWSETLNFNNEE